MKEKNGMCKMTFLEIHSKKHYNLFYILVIISVISVPLQVFAHGDDDESSDETLILSRFVDGNIELSLQSEQWEQSFEKDFDSMWEHDISVKSLNNGTDVYFLLSWEDSTKENNRGESDGAMIAFESSSDGIQEHEEMEKNDSINEVWVWEYNKSDVPSYTFLDSMWEEQKWSVLFGRSIFTSGPDKNIFESGIKKEQFIGLAVWDGSEGESFEKIDDFPHADFILLPKIDTYPKDVFAWSALLVVGAVSFLFVERKLHLKKEMSLNE